MLETFRTSFKSLSQNLWIPSISYLILSAFPLLLGINLLDELMDLSDRSLLLNTLVDRFDFAIFSDFWRLHQSKLNSILLRAAWFIPIIWVLKIFITGGNLDAVTEKSHSLQRYYMQCKKYFWRMFRLDLLQFCLVIVLLAVSFFILFKLLENIDGKNEIQIFYRVAPVVLVSIALLFIISLSKDYAAQKIYFTESHDVRKSYFKSLKYIFSRPSFMFFRMIIYGLGLVWLCIYLEIEKEIKGSSLSIAIFIVVLQQAYVLGKHFLAFWHLFIVQIVQDKRTIG